VGHGGDSITGGSPRRLARPPCYDRTRTTHPDERRIHRVSAEQKTLNVGDPAPDFTLKTIGLKEVSLKDYRGKKVVILFYPLDWTPG
jgi:hypothetical protein